MYDTYNAFVIETLKFYRKKYNFSLVGYTIMPDHLHLLIKLNYPTKISDVVRDIKHAIAFKILSTLRAGQQAPPYPMSKTNRHEAPPQTTTDNLLPGKAGLLALPFNNNLLARLRLENPGKRGHRHSVWEKRFYDFNIHSQKTLKEKIDYIHMNPVRRGLVSEPVDWRYSSFRNYYLDDNSIITIDKL